MLKKIGLRSRFLIYIRRCVHSLFILEGVCLTLCDLMDYSSPGSSVHGILQARILEWISISVSRGSSQPRDWTCIFYTGGQSLFHSATWEVILKGKITINSTLQSSICFVTVHFYLRNVIYFLSMKAKILFYSAMAEPNSDIRK